jgi:hypothetical protein
MSPGASWSLTFSDADWAPGCTTRASPLSWVTIQISLAVPAAIAGDPIRKNSEKNAKVSLYIANTPFDWKRV